jgi:NAD(P)-dependent dehydrogenase (short-subunit alcohol dehydrogenase family)
MREKAMVGQAGDYQGKNGIIFGANSAVGKGLARFLSRSGMNLGLIDLDSYESETLAENVAEAKSRIVYKTVPSGSEEGLRNAVNAIAGDLGGLDYLVCSYYLEDERKATHPDDLEVSTFDKWLEKWVLNYFLVMKAVVPHMIEGKAGRVVFVNTTTGYTGEGEGEGQLTAGWSVHECACSSAITGMMTSIARDVIPQGVSVNGLSLGPGYADDLDGIIWAADLWLSGACEYACAQNLRLY